MVAVTSLATGPGGPLEEWLSASAGTGATQGSNPGTGLAGATAGSSGTPVVALAGMPTASGPAGPARGRSGASNSSGEARQTGCYKCGKQGHYRVNCPERVKTGQKSAKDTKRKRSGASGETPEGKQVKTGASAKVETTKYQKPAFDWSKLVLVVLKKDKQPLSLEEFEEVKGNFVLKEIDLAMREGTMLDINDWCWYQDRVEVKFSNAVSTESFRKLLDGHTIISKAKWEEDHMKLQHFTGKVDRATMKAPVNTLRLYMEKRRKLMGIPGIFRLTKVVCQTPTGAIILISCDDEAKGKWGETSWKRNLVFTIPGTGDVVFQERSKGKKTLQVRQVGGVGGCDARAGRAGGTWIGVQ